MINDPATPAPPLGEAAGPAPSAVLSAGPSPLRSARRFLRRQPLGAVGALMVAFFLIVAILAPQIAPTDYNDTSFLDRLQRPSGAHWFGTDNLGRDQASRIIYGARTSLYVGLGAVTIATAIAIIVGMVSGYLGGTLDLIVQRVVDAWMAFPTLVLLLTLMAVFGAGIGQVIGVLGVSLGVTGVRVIRSATLIHRSAAFVEAARTLGAGTPRILMRHILPNLFGPAIILATVALSASILAEAGLSFLGFGVPPPRPSWGQMLSGSSALYIYNAPWLAIFPGIAITIVVFGVNMLGDALRDELDPRLRGTRS